jgi:signal transduction histidine kinase
MAGVIAAYLLGALLLCTMTYRLLRNSVLEHQAEVDLLQRSLAEVRAAVLEERELLHEVGATLAGITTASRVMRHNHAVPAHRRQRLESMLAAELARRERLLLARSMGSAPSEDLEVAVHDAIEPIVTSHQTRGRNVLWSSCGERAVCDPDELAEVVNILLENAAQHGGGGATCLSVSATDHDLVVTCSDSGPGVLPELRDRLFEPDVRRAGSSGHGLGLAIAHRLVTARGGSLELTDCERPGAKFVARFPSKQLQEALADDDVRHIA